MSSENLTKRIVISGYVIVIVFFVFFLRLWQIQVLEGKQYRQHSYSNRIKVLKIPAPRGIIYDRNGKALVKNGPFYSASLIPGAASEVDTAPLASLLGIDEDELISRLSADVPSFESIKLKEGLSMEEVAFIEARRSDFPGLIIETEVTRHYVYGEIGAHVVGYLGMPGPEKLEVYKNSGIPPDAFTGKWGIEALYDSELTGTPGKKVVEVDALGRQLKLVREEPPVRGEDIRISLDIELQREIEGAFDGKTGAAVALDVESGDILSLVSLPSFDPNLFSRGISASDWRALNENPYFPFLNRALQSQYPPGSVFKLVVAAAALEENILPDGFKVNCRGAIRHGRWTYKCWKRSGHGNVDIHKAIVESCDVFFYEVGRLLGIDKIAEYAERFGLGLPSGIEVVEEKTGFIPTTAWKENTLDQPWYIGETFHASIGQGYVLATPLQQALLVLAVANSGTVQKPSIRMKKEISDVLRRIVLKEETVETLKDGLRGVVNEKKGTAYWSARSNKYVLAGKTGTSQVIRLREEGKKNEEIEERFRDHAWFVSFAPYDDPKIAMSVFVEHGGHGSSAAAPIAKKAMEYYLDTYIEGSEQEGGKIINDKS
ncbi:MAG: penicillin-binding protein 2 [Nitrospirota bacterium]|nr:MAG: penicillin-binding protein 2 [Nitrospirota bacterium]